MGLTFLLLYIILSTIAFLSVVLYGARPARSLSWTIVIFALPFLGILLYLILGVNRRKLKLLTLKQNSRRQLYDKIYDPEFEPREKKFHQSNKLAQLQKLIYENSGFRVAHNNKVKVLSSGEGTFGAIFEAMENAKKFIHLQYYIIEEGEIMDRLYQVCKKKTEEGVEIRILYDTLGSFSWSSKSIKKFKQLGVKMFPILPFEFGSIIFSINHRNHRKIVVIDGKIGFTGGFNVSDKYIKADSELGVWDDTHLELRGPVVQDLHRIFIKDYYFSSKGEQLVNDRYLPKIETAGDTQVQVIADGPDTDQASILQQYLKLISLAQRSICISNPYFIPDSSLFETLKIAALSGVEIDILVPAKSDSKLAKFSMFSYFEDLLRVGISIYTQHDNFLHSKVMVVDGEVVSVGSGNFDVRSFEHNFETNVIVYDQDIASNLFDQFKEDCSRCEKLSLENFSERSIWQKFAEGFARFFSPIL
ncbi:cardiolipin synthase [Sungkyunkwania multivorans]|uniref:Cardiolipin synthase n=1 Tax=Sungkyunkwania multivorans TaxID=1173618 RepID=A0ABW3CVC3_9FLAO